jgi:hypothetical protein
MALSLAAIPKPALIMSTAMVNCLIKSNTDSVNRLINRCEPAGVYPEFWRQQKQWSRGGCADIGAYYQRQRIVISNLMPETAVMVNSMVVWPIAW